MCSDVVASYGFHCTLSGYFHFTAAGLNKLYKVFLLLHFSKQQKNTHCFTMEVSFEVLKYVGSKYERLRVTWCFNS